MRQPSLPPLRQISAKLSKSNSKVRLRYLVDDKSSLHPLIHGKMGLVYRANIRSIKRAGRPGEMRMPLKARPAFHLVAEHRNHLDYGKVAIPIVVGAICRIFAGDPVIRTQRRTILEHYEIVISLAACGVSAFLIIEPENRKRVTPVRYRTAETVTLRKLEKGKMTEKWKGKVGVPFPLHS